MVALKQDGIVFYLRRLTFTFGEFFETAFQLDGILAGKGSIWIRFLVQFVTLVLKQQITLRGSALLLQLFGNGFLYGWTYRLLVPLTFRTYTFGLMTCAFHLLGNLPWKLYAELLFGLCGISVTR